MTLSETTDLLPERALSSSREQIVIDGDLHDRRYRVRDQFNIHTPECRELRCLGADTADPANVA